MKGDIQKKQELITISGSTLSGSCFDYFRPGYKDYMMRKDIHFQIDRESVSIAPHISSQKIFTLTFLEDLEENVERSISKTGKIVIHKRTRLALNPEKFEVVYTCEWDGTSIKNCCSHENNDQIQTYHIQAVMDLLKKLYKENTCVNS